RAQRQGETCHDYVQAVLQLCRASDPTMSEQQKVAHVLKGIAENVFYLIFQQNFSSVDDVLTYCRKLDRELSRRIPASSLLIPRLTNTLAYPVYSTDQRTEPGKNVSSIVVPEDPSISTSNDPLTCLVEKVVEKALSKFLNHSHVNSIRYAGNNSRRDT